MRKKKSNKNIDINQMPHNKILELMFKPDSFSSKTFLKKMSTIHDKPWKSVIFKLPKEEITDKNEGETGRLATKRSNASYFGVKLPPKYDTIKVSKRNNELDTINRTDYLDSCDFKK